MNDAKVIKLKYVADIFSGNSIPDDLKENYEGKKIPYIPTREVNANTGAINYENGLSVDEEDGFKIAPSESVLMCIEGGSAGKKIGIIDRPVAFVNKLCCLHGIKVCPKFLYFALKSKDFTDQFYLNMTGLIGGVPVSSLKNLFISFPKTITEQEKIAGFLEKKCHQIDLLIANQQGQIEKLNQYRKNLITELVTHGLQGESDLVCSDYPWIGPIPSNWKIIRKLSFVTNTAISYGIVKLFEPDDIDGVKVLRCSDVLEGYISEENIRTVTKEISNEYSRTILNGGEVVVNVRGSLGGCSVVPNEMAGYNIAREVARISVDESMCNRYVMYYLLSNSFTDYRTSFLSGSVYVGLNIELLSSCPIPCPPLTEQIDIADYLDKKCSQINQLIAIKQHKIDSLEEYKNSIIYEYVTGKKEVS